MKAFEVIPGIIGGVAGYAVLKLGTDDPLAMTSLAFSIAFLICCHNAKAITLRAVIAGLLAAPAGMFAIGLLHMDLSPHPGEAWYESGYVGFGLISYFFAGVSYHVGKKCKPVSDKEIAEVEARKPRDKDDLISQRSEQKTAHILHLLITILTIGFWIPVWIFMSLYHARKRRDINKELQDISLMASHKESK